MHNSLRISSRRHVLIVFIEPTCGTELSQNGALVASRKLVPGRIVMVQCIRIYLSELGCATQGFLEINMYGYIHENNITLIMECFFFG